MTKQPKQPKQSRTSLKGRLGAVRAWDFRRWIIVAVSGVAVLIVGVILYGTAVILLSTQSQVSTSESTDSQDVPVEEYVDPEVDQAVNQALFNNDVEGAVEAYDTALQGASSSEEQAALHLRIGSVYLNNNQLDLALESGLRAEALTGRTLQNVTFLAIVYQLLGNNQKAAEYYRIAAEVTPNEGATAGDKEYYLSQAEELES